MRTNVPVDTHFGVLNEPTKPKLDSSKETKVAGIAKTKQWAIVKDELQSRIISKKAQLYTEEYPNLSMEEIGKRFLVAREVIKELDSIISFVETTFDAVTVQPKRP